VPNVKFYEQGKVAGDFMRVLDTIEARNEWAIVHDHSDGTWQVFVNGESRGPCYTQAEAQQLMQRCIQVACPYGVDHEWEHRSSRMVCAKCGREPQ
jgi:hypothetical protein